jgi:hypothetical protein
MISRLLAVGSRARMALLSVIPVIKLGGFVRYRKLRRVTIRDWPIAISSGQDLSGGVLVTNRSRSRSYARRRWIQAGRRQNAVANRKL